MSKNTFKRNADLLLLEGEGKRHHFLIKYFNTFIHSSMIINYIVEGNFFCRYCLQDFSATEILQSHVNDFFRTDGK